MSRFILKGRWYGEPHDPERYFQGTVEDPGHTGLQQDDVVRVKFEAGRFTAHTNPTQQHGHYSLDGMPSEEFVLASFVRRDGAVGEEAVGEGEPQLWGGDLFSKGEQR